MTSYRIELQCSEPEALELLAEASEVWGGEWHRDGRGGKLLLPINAGLRQGVVAAEARLSREGAGTRVEVTPIETEMHLNRGATGVLVFGALGGLVAMLWPFFPDLLQIAPVAAILAVVAWLLVASRLRTHGLEEFTALVEETGAGAEDENVVSS